VWVGARERGSGVKKGRGGGRITKKKLGREGCECPVGACLWVNLEGGGRGLGTKGMRNGKTEAGSGVGGQGGW